MSRLTESVEVKGDFRAKYFKARIQVLEDVNQKLSIVPLLEAGEFGTISEGMTEADIEIREGRFSDYIEKLADKVPSAVRGGVKNFLVTKDTQLFKTLNRAVQYGDFVAKAVLYDHLTQKKGMSKEAALGVISEEFVNYNRLPGRGRDYLESIGLLWFYNYKLRITKVALKMARERPLTALLMVGGVEPLFGADTVFSSSLPDLKTGPVRV